MAIAQVPVASIVTFCLVLIGAVLIVRNLNAILTIVSNLWAMLPPNDVLMRYAAIAAISIFSLYVINYTVVQRKPINLEIMIKDNKYIEFNDYSASAFCIAAVISIIYCVYANNNDNNNNNNNNNNTTNNGSVASAIRRFDPMQIALFAFIFYGLVQIYYMLLWGITNTPVFKA
jgi:hypothetical protein